MNEKQPPILSDEEIDSLLHGFKPRESSDGRTRAPGDAADYRFVPGQTPQDEDGFAVGGRPRRAEATDSNRARRSQSEGRAPIVRPEPIVTSAGQTQPESGSAVSASASGRKENLPRRENAFSLLPKAAAVLVMIFFSIFLLPSGGKMSLASVTVSTKDRGAVYGAASANLLSDALAEIHQIPKVYILERNDDPTPLPNPEGFSTMEDPERVNYDGSPIDCYKDPTIEVRCWREKEGRVIYNFAEIWIADASQFRRKLVDDVVSKKHLDFPSNIFHRMQGVVGMSSDYCAYRSFGTIVQNGHIVRDRASGFLDLMVVDKDANLTYTSDRDFMSGSYCNNPDVIYTFAFGPMLIDDYKINPSRSRLNEYLIGEPSHKYPRAAIAQFGYDKHYLLVTADYPGTDLQHFTEVIQKKNVRFAYNLDGGQTAALMFHDKLFNVVAYGGEREVSDILFFATAIPNE